LIRIEKGQVIKNTDYYCDKAQRIKDLEAVILQTLGLTEQSYALCALLKTMSSIFTGSQTNKIAGCADG